MASPRSAPPHSVPARRFSLEHSLGDMTPGIKMRTSTPDVLRPCKPPFKNKPHNMAQAVSSALPVIPPPHSMALNAEGACTLRECERACLAHDGTCGKATLAQQCRHACLHGLDDGAGASDSTDVGYHARAQWCMHSTAWCVGERSYGPWLASCTACKALPPAARVPPPHHTARCPQRRTRVGGPGLRAMCLHCCAPGPSMH